MMHENEIRRVESHQIARWLRRRCYFALSLIALFIIAGQVLLHHHLLDQQHTATVVNIAGRQRMLSERILRLIDWCTSESTFLEECRTDPGGCI